MKNKILLLGFVFALLPNSLEVVSANEITETKSIKIASIADTHVSAGANADLNYGRYANMNVRGRATKDKNYYESYLKFSLPNVVKSVNEAKLNLTYHTVNDDAVGRKFTIYTTDTSWNEGSGNVNGEENATVENKLTYNTASSLATTHDDNYQKFEITGTAPVRGDVLTIDVKSIINEYLKDYEFNDDPTEISFRIVSDGTTNEKDLLFRTKENVNGGAPTLSLTYDYTYTPIEPEEIYEGLSFKEEEIYNSAGFDVDMHTLELDKSSNLSIITGVPYNKVPLQVGLRQTPSGQAQSAQDAGYNVLAAINADFFRINEDDAIQPRGLTVKNGIELTPTNEWKFFGVLKDGSFIIGDASVYNARKSEIMHAVGGDSGYLVENGVPITVNADGGCHSEDVVAPRTAIGLKADGSVVMTVADGRSDISNGLVLVDLANYMVEQGCVTAINLDGGGSSAMSIKNKETNTFAAVNNPSDGSEREVGNTLLIIDPTTSIDKTEINNTLKQAEQILNTYPFGDIPGQYPSALKTKLQEAVDEAKALLAQSTTTQQKIDEVNEKIKNIILEIEASYVPVDRTELNSLVNKLDSLIKNSVFGIEKDNYPVEQKAILEKAFEDALVVLTKSDATQDELDLAAAMVKEVIDNFEKSKIIADTRELRTSISQLEETIDNIEDDDNYTEEEKQALKVILLGAKEILNDNSASQEEIDLTIDVIKNMINELNKTDEENSNDNDNNINDSSSDIIEDPNNDTNNDTNNNLPIDKNTIIIACVAVLVIVVGIVVFRRRD